MKNILSNTFTGYFKFIVQFVTNLIFIPILIAYVGKEEYGLWIFLLSMLMGSFELLDFGFSVAVVKFVSESQGSGDVQKRNHILSMILVFYLALMGIGLVVLGSIYPFFEEWFSIPIHLRSLTSTLFWILGFRLVVFFIPLSIFRGILFGVQKISIVNGVSSIAQVAYVLLSVLALMNGGGLIEVAMINLTVMVVEHLVYWILSYRFLPDLHFSFKNIRWESLKEVAGFSMAQSVANVSSFVHIRADPLIIQFFLSLSSVAVYGVALKILTFAIQLIKQVSIALTPVFARLKGENDESGLKDVMLRGTKYSLGIATLIILPGLILAKPLILFWIGGSFEDTILPMQVLLVTLFFSTPQMIATNLLAMSGHHRLMAKFEMLGTFCNVGFSIALVNLLGLLGVAVGTMIATFFVGILLALPRTCKVVGISFYDYMVESVIPVIIPGLIQVSFLFGIQFLFPLDNLWMTFVYGSVSGCLFLFFFWSFSMDQREREIGTNFILRRSD